MLESFRNKLKTGVRVSFHQKSGRTTFKAEIVSYEAQLEDSEPFFKLVAGYW
jgi:hypothetical protein